jgi:hypothetical protein
MKISVLLKERKRHVRRMKRIWNDDLIDRALAGTTIVVTMIGVLILMFNKK